MERRGALKRRQDHEQKGTKEKERIKGIEEEFGTD